MPCIPSRASIQGEVQSGVIARIRSSAAVVCRERGGRYRYRCVKGWVREYRLDRGFPAIEFLADSRLARGIEEQRDFFGGQSAFFERHLADCASRAVRFFDQYGGSVVADLGCEGGSHG